MDFDKETNRIDVLEELINSQKMIIAFQKTELDRLNEQIKESTAQLEATKTNSPIPENKIDPESKKESKQVKKTRDTTKYFLNNTSEPLKKNRLVLAVVKKYVENNPTISPKELMEVFSKDLNGFPLQGSLGCVRMADDVRNAYSECERRFFMENHDLIKLGEDYVTVCSQWQESTINPFIEYAKTLGMQITPTK